MIGSEMDILDELKGDIRPAARRINLSSNPYAALCVTLWLLCKELRLSAELEQEALEEVMDVLDGEPPSKRSGLKGVVGN